MKTKILASISGLLVSLLTPLAILVPQASAAVLTWDGDSVDNNYFSTAANWSGDTVPVDGDSITFDLSLLSENELLVNDLTDLDLVGISVTGTGTGFNYDITGNAITLSGEFSGASTAGSYVTINLAVTLGASLNLNAVVDGIRFNGTSSSVALGINSITLNHNSYLYIRGVSGSGDINISQGTVYIAGSPMLPSYTGTVYATGSGGLSILGNSLPAQSEVIMNTTGMLTLITGNVTSFFGVPITIGGLASSSNIYTFYDLNADPITLSGGLTLTSDITAQLEVDLIVGAPYANAFDISVLPFSDGVVTLPSGETVTQTKETVTIGADDKSTAPLIVGDQKTYIVNGERGDTIVAGGGVLKGTGKVGVLNVQNLGKLAPGLSPGCISSGNLTLSGIYEIEIAGTTVCTEYDQTVVTGTVDVTGGTLQVLPFLNGYKPADNAAFMIINNDAADAVVGTFAGLADGATFTVDGYTIQINYNGGDGNDVMLLVTEVPAVPDTGIGSILTNPLLALGATLAAFTVVGGLKFADKRRK